MREEATLEQWKRLYDFGKRFKERKPWQLFCNVDLFAVTPEGKETGYFIIYGNGGYMKGLSLYIGEKGFNSLLGMIKREETGLDELLMMAEQNCISMFYGERDDVPEKQYQIIRQLGMKFRGNGNWLYFERYEPGYQPFILNAGESDTFELYMDKLLDAIEYFLQNSTEKFSTREPKLYSYYETGGQWKGEFVPLPQEKYSCEIIELNDEVGLRRLKKQKKTDMVWEVDCFVEVSGNCREGEEKPLWDKNMIVMDHNQHTILSHEILSINDSLGKGTSVVLDLIMQLGRPREVIVANMYTEAMIRQPLEACGVKVTPGKVEACEEVKSVWLYDGMDSLDFDEVTPREMEEAMNILNLLGMDKEKLMDMAGRMTPEEFEESIKEEMMHALDSMYIGDFEEDFPSYERVELKSRKKKLAAVRDFFGEGDIPEEDYELYDKWLEISYSGKQWEKTLQTASKEELFAYAENMGALVDKSYSKTLLISIVMSMTQKDKKNLKNLLSKEENKLMKELKKKAASIDNEIDLEEFKYTREHIEHLIKLGLVDVGMVVSEEEMILELHLVEEIGYVWNGK